MADNETKYTLTANDEMSSDFQYKINHDVINPANWSEETKNKVVAIYTDSGIAITIDGGEL